MITRRRLLLSTLLSVCLGLSAQEKPIVTVLDLQTDGVSAGEMRSAISLLSSELFKTSAYTVIDTTERDRLMEEIEFSVSDCTDQSCQLEIGKMLSAELLVMGNLSLVGSKYVVTLKLVETESARTIGTADGTYPNAEKLIEDMAALVAQLRGAKAHAKVSGRTVAGIATVSGGLLAGAAAGVLIGLAATDMNGTVAGAYQSYLDLPADTPQTDIDTAYDAYVEAFSGSRAKLIGGVVAVSAGVALLGTSLVLLLPPREAASPKAPRVSLLPAADLRGLTVRLSY